MAINIMSGIAVSQEGISMNELSVQALAVQFFETKNELYRVKKQLKIEKDKNLQNNHDEDSSTINENQNLEHIIDEAIAKVKLRSTILIDTRQYLKTLLIQPCLNCHNNYDKELEVLSIGFGVKTRIICNKCKKITEYKNETNQNNFSVLVSSVGLAGDANRQQIETIFSTVGIISQIVKKSYHNYQKKFFDILHHAAMISAEEALKIACSYIVNIGEKILPVSFDVFWSHVRNANQASGELILQKELLAKDQEESQIIYKGNFDKSFRQIEHAILIEILEKIQPSLDKYDLMLDISVDEDLNSNKTLSNVRSVNKIYGDLKHIGKNIRKKIIWKNYENVIMKYYTQVVYAASARKEDSDIKTPEDQEVLDLQINGLVAHLSGDHSLCWEDFCWHKSNIDLKLPEPNLLKHNNFKRASFRSILIESYQARHACAILHNNYGIDHLIETLRSIEEKNQKEITQRNEEREKKIEEQKNQTETFDFDQDLIPYGKNVKLKIETQEFIPSFSHLIHDFMFLLKCHACLSFSKYSSTGLCKISNTEISVEKKIDMVVNKVFGFSGYREKQYESIISFINEKNTLVILPTGSGKTLCWATSALISEGLTVVFIPLKALIDDQIRELINIRIPCAGLYTSTSNPSNYQEKVFGEIAAGFLRVLFITPEKFHKNYAFRSMLVRISQIRPIHFVVDEVHYIIEQEYFHAVRHQSITRWKAGLTQVMIATNAFGLGINMSNIRLVIHYTFPLSLGNLIQEAGRAGRDRREAKHIVYYSRQDIKTVYGIVAGEQEGSTNDIVQNTEYQEYLEERQKKILEVMFFCESQYECRQKLLMQYYSWASDEEILPCERCDNYLHRQNHCPIIQDVRQDVLYLLQVVNAVTNYMKNNNENTTHVYKEDYNRILKRQEEVAYLFKDLVIRGLVKVHFKLNKSTPTSQMNCNLIYTGITKNAIERASIGSWFYSIKNRQK
ncbi:17214_t:CDS:10 [Funneliformis caledonium]|uniref:DNA 3'-5' helicase n=1 Tax=Funneliformis caledonium TaxID=1117310 RepID=A0A9N9AZG2_9GLOM|nr:17214_t:CDS:10 [Funneliformis caledonium]